MLRLWKRSDPCLREDIVRVKGGKKYMATRTYKMNLKCLAASWIGTGALFSD